MHKGGKPFQAPAPQPTYPAPRYLLPPPPSRPTLHLSPPLPPHTDSPTLHPPHRVPNDLPCTAAASYQVASHHLPSGLPCTSPPPTKAASSQAAYPAPPSRRSKTGQQGDRARPSPSASQPAYPAPRPGQRLQSPPPSPRSSSPVRLAERNRWRALAGKSRRRRAYPQQIVTTRLLYCLQDPFAQLSRLQRI